MDSDTWPRKVDKTIVTGSNARGCLRKTWYKCKRNDFEVEGLEASLTQIGLHGVGHSTPRFNIDMTVKLRNPQIQGTMHIKLWSK